MRPLFQMKFTGSLFRSIRTKNLSYNGFQERLQKVSNEKTTLEQKKNEITVLLSSSDAKIIQPELIQILLEQFLLVYKQASRDRQKHLLQLLLQKLQLNIQMVNHVRLILLKSNLIFQRSTFPRPLHLSTCCIEKRIMKIAIHSQYPLLTTKYHLIYNFFCLYL